MESIRRMRLIVKIYAIPVALLGILVVIRWLKETSFSYFTRDPADFAGYPFYLGLYSNLGMVVWGFCTGVLWFTYAMVRGGSPPGVMKPGAERFILTSAISTTILYLDDLFQFHERLFPDYLGVSQLIVLAAYAVWFSWWLYMNYSVIRESESYQLFTALFFWGASGMLDLGEHLLYLPGHHLWEDGSKFLGITGWCVYFCRFSLREVRAFLRGVPTRV